MDENPPLWWFKIKYFKSNKDWDNSVLEWRFIDYEKKIIWKKRFEKALLDSGLKIEKIPNKIDGFDVI